MIQLKDVSKSYKVVADSEASFLHKLFAKKEMKPVIRGVSFSVNEGEIVGYLGHNGAGKSTTIKMILGIIPYDSGEITVFGKQPFKYRQQNAQFIGGLFGQKSQLWWDLPLIDSFLFLQKIYGCNTEADKVWLEWLIQELKVDDYMNEPVRELSLGQRMRGEFICALVHQPRLVLLDEPTIGLDVQTKQHLMEMILKINAEYKTTFLITSHDFYEIEKVCHKIIMLDKGRIVYDGSIQAYKQQYGHYKKVTVQTNGEEAAIQVAGLRVLSKNIDSIEYYIDQQVVSEQEVLVALSTHYATEAIMMTELSLSEITVIKGLEAS